MGAWPDCTGGVWVISKLRIAIVGLGSMGKVYLNCFQRMDLCSVIAVVSRCAKAETYAVYPTLEAMLEAEEIDLICACTPTDLHVQQVKLALEHDCHVICEKPLALHREEAAELYALAAKKQRLLLPAHVVRFALSSEWLREAVTSGRYGRICEAFFSRLSTMPYWCSGNWAYDITRSGHVPFDLHIHDLDLMISTFGAPKHAYYEGSGTPDLPFNEHCWFTYEYEGFSVHAEAAWYRAAIPFTAAWRVSFEKALVLCRDGVVTVYETDQPPYEIRESTVHETGFSVPATDMYDRELQSMVHCILHDEKPQLLPAEEILLAIDILEGFQSTGHWN